jgi:hypothetical protein
MYRATSFTIVATDESGKKHFRMPEAFFPNHQWDKIYSTVSELVKDLEVLTSGTHRVDGAFLLEIGGFSVPHYSGKDDGKPIKAQLRGMIEKVEMIDILAEIEREKHE